METINTIGSDGCACGDYESNNLIAEASCRKSSESPSCSIGIAHLLKYQLKNSNGINEIGKIVDKMLNYGGDCIVIEKLDKLPTQPQDK